MCSVLRALQLGWHRVRVYVARVSLEKCGGAGGERDTLVSLWSLYAARWRAATGALALMGGVGEAVPARLQIHGQPQKHVNLFKYQ